MSVFIAIDLKSFYASVECVERGLNPLKTHLVVADASRTEKTICLAVSPSLKSYGLPGRPRLFEVVEKVKTINRKRLRDSGQKTFTSKSTSLTVTQENPGVKLDYIVAAPRMALYMQYSAKIYSIYLKYIAPEDIHMYSIDEVFIDATRYLKTYKSTVQELTMRMIRDVLSATGITATAGIGSNLYLAKIAMDIVAKNMPPDKNGVRLAQLTEKSYRTLLWSHRPLTDFWRIGAGYAEKLHALGLDTMGQIARASLANETAIPNAQTLYKTFGINAELLIDHAWGRETTTLAAIKSYRPEANSVGSGQVLMEPYNAQKARLVLGEMADALALDLVSKNLITEQLSLSIGYDITSLRSPKARKDYKGIVVDDGYGRAMPSPVHSSIHIGQWTSSGKLITQAFYALFDRINHPALLVRRLSIAALSVANEDDIDTLNEKPQLDLFSDATRCAKEQAELKRETKRQRAILNIKAKFGKNALVRGFNMQEGATQMARNAQIGGHKA